MILYIIALILAVLPAGLVTVVNSGSQDQFIAMYIVVAAIFLFIAHELKKQIKKEEEEGWKNPNR